MKKKIKKLSDLSDFPERVEYLLEERWGGTKRGFCNRYNISKTTLYLILKKQRTDFSDYVIDRFARAFDVDFNFLKFGGDDEGYYKPQNHGIPALKEGGSAYGKNMGRPPRYTTVAVSKAEAEFRLDEPDGLMEILLRIKYGDILF